MAITKQYARVWGIFKTSEGKVHNGTVKIEPATGMDANLKAENTFEIALKNGKFSVRVLRTDCVGQGAWSAETPYNITIELDYVNERALYNLPVSKDIDLASEARFVGQQGVVTTKGDIEGTLSGGMQTRVPLAVDGGLLMSDYDELTGVKWTGVIDCGRVNG